MEKDFVYVPYGDEWKKQMMKLKKETIISMMANVGRERDQLEILYCPECGERFRAFRGVRLEIPNRVYIGKRRFVYLKFLKLCKCGKFPYFL